MTAGEGGSGHAPKRQKNAPGAGAGAAPGGRRFGWLQPPVKLSSAADWRAAAAATAAIARSGGATTKRRRPDAGRGRSGGDSDDDDDDDAPGSDDEVDYERRRRALVLRARREGEYRGDDDDGSWMEDEDEDEDVEEWERGGAHRGYSVGKQSEDWDYYYDDDGDEEARGDYYYYEHDQHERAQRYGRRAGIPRGRVGVDRQMGPASLASSFSSFRREVRGQMAAVTASVEQLAGAGDLTVDHQFHSDTQPLSSQ